MLDVTLFGVDPGMHHLVNALFHLLNTLLLFFLLRGMTGSLRRSAVVAALFAFHPLHVESVAWISERKDVLSTFFFLLSMQAYHRYSIRPGFLRYLPIVLFMVLGLMSKPMLVTLPFVLMLLDYWPLGRMSPDNRAPKGTLFSHVPPLGRLLLEKVPLLILSGASCAITIFAQKGGDSIGQFPLVIRAGNAAISYVTYIRKVLWPSSLTIFYPHPKYSISLALAAGAGLLLSGATVFAAFQARKRPYLLMGWLWYLGTLVPVIGLVQAGNQAMADRYTYIPLVGLFIAAVWGMAEVAAGWRIPKRAMTGLAGIWLAALAGAAWLQVGYWRGPVPLFSHALEVTKDNWIAHHVLGEEALRTGQYDDAIAHFTEALRIRPYQVPTLSNLGVAFMRTGKLDEAIAIFRMLLPMTPGNASLHFNLGLALGQRGKFDEAADQFRAYIHLVPNDPAGTYQLNLNLARKNVPDPR
jgi:hypothetical protein